MGGPLGVSLQLGRIPSLEKTGEVGRDGLSSSWLGELLFSCCDIILARATPRKEGAVPQGRAVVAAGAGSPIVHIRGQAAVSDSLLFFPSEPSQGLMPLRFRAGVFSTSLTDMPQGACSFSDARSRCVEDQC